MKNEVAPLQQMSCRLSTKNHNIAAYTSETYEMRLSMSLVLIALMSYVVHGFSSPIILTQQPRTIIGSSSHSRFKTLDHVSGMRKITTTRGGAVVTGGQKLAAASPAATGSKCPATSAATVAASLWGAGGVIYILAKAIKRVIPIAMEPFQAGSVPLNNFQLGYENMITKML